MFEYFTLDPISLVHGARPSFLAAFLFIQWGFDSFLRFGDLRKGFLRIHHAGMAQASVFWARGPADTR